MEAASTRVSLGCKAPKGLQVPKGEIGGIKFWFGEDVDLGLLHQILEQHQVWVEEERDLGINGSVLMEDRETWTSSFSLGKKTHFIRSHEIQLLCAVFCPAVLPPGPMVLPMTGVLAVPQGTARWVLTVLPQPEG